MKVSHHDHLATWGQAKLDSLPISSLNVYVDGSMLEDGSVGAGIFLDYDGTIINRFYKLTGGAHSAYQGELVAILLAIRLVQELEIPALRPAFIVSDCQSAIQASLSPKRDNFLGNCIFDELQSSHAINNFVWIPSHVGIPGNDAADALASYGAEQDTFTFEVPTDLASWKSRIKCATSELWACEWDRNVWDCPSLHVILPDLRHHPNFLLGNNRLDKQLARIRMDYVSLNGFLFRHGLSAHNRCDGCFCLNGSSIKQSCSHVLLSCPIYADERKSMLSSIESTLHLANTASLLDLLVPSSVTATDFAVAEAICSFISNTMSGFL